MTKMTKMTTKKTKKPQVEADIEKDTIPEGTPAIPVEALPEGETIQAPENLEQYIRSLMNDAQDFHVDLEKTESGDVRFHVRLLNSKTPHRSFEVIGDLTKNITRLPA